MIEDTNQLSLTLRKCYNQSMRYNSAISIHILLMCAAMTKWPDEERLFQDTSHIILRGKCLFVWDNYFSAASRTLIQLTAPHSTAYLSNLEMTDIQQKKSQQSTETHPTQTTQQWREYKHLTQTTQLPKAYKQPTQDVLIFSHPLFSNFTHNYKLTCKKII